MESFIQTSRVQEDLKTEYISLTGSQFYLNFQTATERLHWSLTGKIEIPCYVKEIMLISGLVRLKSRDEPPQKRVLCMTFC